MYTSYCWYPPIEVFSSYHDNIEPSPWAETSLAVEFTLSKLSTNVTVSILSLAILVLPKNPFVASFSELADANLLINIILVSLFLFPDLSITAPSGISNLTCLIVESDGIFVRVNVTSWPYFTVDVVPFSDLVSVKLFEVIVFPTLVDFVPFTYTAVLVDNVLVAKYLSVPWIVTVPVLAFASTVKLVTSMCGATTSTTSAVPVLSGKSIPVVIVVAVFWFDESSFAFEAGIATVITPL